LTSEQFFFTVAYTSDLNPLPPAPLKLQPYTIYKSVYYYYYVIPTCVDSKASCGVTDCRSTLCDLDMWQSQSGDGSRGCVVRFSTMYLVLPWQFQQQPFSRSTVHINVSINYSKSYTEYT